MCATSWTFPRSFQPPAAVVTLEQNYRSTQPILAASNAVIGLARERFTKNLRSHRGRRRETRHWSRCSTTSARSASSSRRSCENREAGTALKEQAVLFRTARITAPCSRSSWPGATFPFVKFGGLKFIEAAHVKDMLAVLRWAENPADRVTGFRVLQLLEGIGPATAGKVLDRMGGRSPARRARDLPAAGQGGRSAGASSSS